MKTPKQLTQPLKSDRGETRQYRTSVTTRTRLARFSRSDKKTVSARSKERYVRSTPSTRHRREEFVATTSFRAGTKDANARANALAALVFIQFVISLAQVWVASTRLRLSKKAEPTKETEGSFEDNAVVAPKEPPAEEPTSEKSSGCVAS